MPYGDWLHSHLSSKTSFVEHRLMRRKSESAPQAPSYLHLQVSVSAFGQQEWTHHAAGHGNLICEVHEAFFMQI